MCVYVGNNEQIRVWITPKGQVSRVLRGISKPKAMLAQEMNVTAQRNQIKLTSIQGFSYLSDVI